MGAREDQNTLDMITKKLQGLQSTEDVGKLMASFIDEGTLSRHAVDAVGEMAELVKDFPIEMGRLVLGTAYTIGFATGIEFAKIRNSEVPSL